MAPLIEYMKKESFEWTKVVQRAFEVIKDKLYLAAILSLPNFKLLLEVECDATGVGVLT